jgi:carbon storage regulator
MLVLSRKVGEEILLSGGITVTLVRIDGNRVRIGIDAPDGVNIRRGELTPRSPHTHPDYRTDAPGGP